MKVVAGTGGSSSGTLASPAVVTFCRCRKFSQQQSESLLYGTCKAATQALLSLATSWTQQTSIAPCRTQAEGPWSSQKPSHCYRHLL